ncbi:MAG: hypothetical protein WAR57_01195 [Candidatus Phosphoribacter sp.]
MPRKLRPLPDALVGRPFNVADARRLGVTEGRLRHRSLVAVTRGSRSPRIASSLVQTARALAVVVEPDSAFSHDTAARLLGLPMAEPWVSSAPLDLMRPTDSAFVRRRGVRAHRGLERRAVVTIDGLRVVSGVDTWGDLATRVPLDELVVIGDALAARGIPLAHLYAAVARRRGQRGIRRLREASALVKSGSRSRMETLARLAFGRAGLPEPALNADVHDEDGQWILCADFLWRAKRVIGEYQGDQHRSDRRRWRSDVTRRRLAEDNGWTYVELTARDLFDRAAHRQLIARLGHLLGTARHGTAPHEARSPSPRVQ